MSDKSDENFIFRLFYWAKVITFVKVTKTLSDIVLSDENFIQ